MRPRDWITVAGALVLVVGVLAFFAALPPPSPAAPFLTTSPKAGLNLFNAVHGVGSYWIALGISVVGIILLVIGTRE